MIEMYVISSDHAQYLSFLSNSAVLKKKSLCNLGWLIHVIYLLRIECERQEILTKPFSHIRHMIKSSLNVYVLT